MIEIFETCQTKSIAKQTNREEPLIIMSIVWMKTVQKHYYPFSFAAFTSEYVCEYLTIVKPNDNWEIVEWDELCIKNGKTSNRSR